MTLSRVSGRRLSSARPLSTLETVEAWTFAAFATSVIVTRRPAKSATPRVEIDCFRLYARKSFPDYPPNARKVAPTASAGPRGTHRVSDALVHAVVPGHRNERRAI